MRVIGSSRVVGSKATPGLPSAVLLPRLRAHETAGVRARCSDPLKKCSAGDGKRTGSCASTGVVSVQGKGGRKDRRREGSMYSRS